MAKAINWPESFREEILGEDFEALHIALRIGELYFTNQYWVPDEIVDIRVNHLKIRQGVVVGELRQCCLGALTDNDYMLLKSTLRTRENVIAFLAANYQVPVDNDTLVTIVTYRNKPLIPEDIET